jgi:hypothetical protein
VTVSLSATLVARVIGIETVAFVVGGSVVVVTVKVNVSSTSLDSVAVFVIKNVSVSVTATLVARVIGTTTVAFVVGGLAVYSLLAVILLVSVKRRTNLGYRKRFSNFNGAREHFSLNDC